MAKARILCIEDNPEIIDLIRLILERHDFEVEGAVGGREGLDAVLRQPPELILLDLMMPDMDGWEVYREIKSRRDLRDIPVIVVTAKAQEIDRVLGLQIAGVDAYITKPFDPQDLEATVDRVLGLPPRIGEGAGQGLETHARHETQEPETP